MKSRSFRGSVSGMGKECWGETLLEFNTLRNAVYMNLHNDISFVIVDRIQLYEHQSTLPVNLPLRDLLYIADILQKMVVDKSIYGSRRLMKSIWKNYVRNIVLFKKRTAKKAETVIAFLVNQSY